MTAFSRRPLAAALLIGLAAQLLFSVNLTRPSTPMFDEVHYVPAARAMLALDRPMNTEHPPLGKEIVAAGIAAFGDNPLGWRAFSTVAGTATVLGVFAMLWLLFGSVRTASYGALFAALNFTLFIQARIAMLDVFLGAFVTLGIASLLWAMRAPPGRVMRRWLLGAVLLGLATATKWAAAPYVALAMAAFAVVRRRHAAAWRGLTPVRALLLLGIVSVAAYFVTFAPMLFYAHDALAPSDIVPFQWRMYQNQTRILSPHPYQSSWWSWPLMIRPIWYLYEPVDGAVRGVLLVGNPVMMWGGLAAVAALLWAWARGSAKAGAVALLWIASLAVWAVIPKSLGFYYYYHLSGIFLCVALAAACHLYGRESRSRWVAATAIAAALAFVHFYPIIAAGALPDAQRFNRWMWFDSWR